MIPCSVIRRWFRREVKLRKTVKKPRQTGLPVRVARDQVTCLEQSCNAFATLQTVINSQTSKFLIGGAAKRHVIDWYTRTGQEHGAAVRITASTTKAKRKRDRHATRMNTDIDKGKET